MSKKILLYSHCQVVETPPDIMSDCLKGKWYDRQHLILVHLLPIPVHYLHPSVARYLSRD